MKNILIITAKIHADTKLNFSNFDYVICADKGLDYAINMGLEVDYAIGDFDSSSLYSPSHIPEEPDESIIEKLNIYTKNIEILPVEKDLTDTEAALDFAITKNPQSITILGGLSGRLDHSLGNLALLSKYINANIIIDDGNNRARMLKPGTYKITKDSRFKYLSLISYSSHILGLEISDTKYQVSNCILRNNSTLGVSNEITSDCAKISFESGRLLVIESNE